MNHQVEEWLAHLAPDVQAMCRAVREVARTMLPSAHEMVYHDTLGYAPSASPADRVCYIAPQQGYVNLGFFFGSNLPDPKHLLMGTGTRMRHVKVRTIEEAENHALADLLRAAWYNAPDSLAKLHSRGKRT